MTKCKQSILEINILLLFSDDDLEGVQSVDGHCQELF